MQVEVTCDHGHVWKLQTVKKPGPNVGKCFVATDCGLFHWGEIPPTVAICKNVNAVPFNRNNNPIAVNDNTTNIRPNTNNDSGVDKMVDWIRAQQDPRNTLLNVTNHLFKNVLQ